MDVTVVSLIASIIALLVSVFVFLRLKDADSETGEPSFTTKPLQLQAYERLVLLCERIALPNLISRVSQPGATAREMQVFLIDSIKQEFEYNISQQVYISTLAWDAVRNLRDQNMLIINQIANVLPPDATAHDLNKQLLQVILKEHGKALHSMALEALNIEAKQLMN